MPLLNYTTEISAERSIAEVQKLLTAGGATAILLLTDASRRVSAVHFRLKTNFGETTFELPADAASVSLAINAQIDEETRTRGRKERKIPIRLMNNREQAERIAWRIVKDWLEVQLAMHAIGAAKLEQILLPFAVDDSGKTFYRRLLDRGGPLQLK